MNNEKTYKLDWDEDAREFVRRIINAQDDCEPLRIVEQLVGIVVDELKDRPYDASAFVTSQRMKVTLCHQGRPIDARMVRVMGNHTDRVDYRSEGDDWILTIRRDIPPLIATRR